MPETLSVAFLINKKKNGAVTPSGGGGADPNQGMFFNLPANSALIVLLEDI